MALRVRQLKLNDILLSPSSLNKTDLERTDVGAMVTDRLFPQLAELIAEAVSQGARLLVGGKQWVHPEFPTAHYWEPTLLVDVMPDMRIAQEEIFAPVMTVMKYDMLGEAISIANGTRYGLGASVFGRSKEDCRYVVSRLNAGMVCTNGSSPRSSSSTPPYVLSRFRRFVSRPSAGFSTLTSTAVFYLNQSLPFGGCKSSGHGRFAGPEGLRGLCNLKAVTEDRFHGSLQTGIPPLLAYPIKSGEAAWTFVSGLVRMMYGCGVGERVGGMWDLVTAKP